MVVTLSPCRRKEGIAGLSLRSQKGRCAITNRKDLIRPKCRVLLVVKDMPVCYPAKNKSHEIRIYYFDAGGHHPGRCGGGWMG
ncbi:MAG: hypothetical protein QGG01_04625, partial [Roseibacillus sp.]|nr:hypothetical protein [Roseibacillus sp.]